MSQTSTPTIFLPKGGGAISGLGEKFSPDLHTGTGNLSLPIAVPPGRNGFQPELTLQYSTGHGNGPFGLGWVLSVPGVSRQTAKGLPKYDDSNDTFILSGSEDLVPVSDASKNVVRYRPRTEGLFARIEHHRTPDQNYWLVRSKQGLVSFYGEHPDRPDEKAQVADPENRSKIFIWKLVETNDTFGNRIVYGYERDSNGKFDQVYLTSIRYADFVDEAGEQFVVSVTLVYDDRPDPFVECRAGFPIHTRKRCNRIEMRTHTDETRLVKTYSFVYADQRSVAGVASNGLSLLHSVQITGHDGDHEQSPPPVDFGYTSFGPSNRQFVTLSGSELPSRSLADPDTELVDLFGNGLPDIIETREGVRYWRNKGDGTFDVPRSMRSSPAGLRLSQPGVQLIDADGNGRADLVATLDGLSGYFPLSFTGEWDQNSFRRYRQAPSFSLEDPEVRLVDLTGEGITDAIRSGSRMECYFNSQDQGWHGTDFVTRGAPEDFPDVAFSDARVRLADMNGDGLPDIAIVHDRNVEYWSSLGYGRWGGRVSMRKAPSLPSGYDPRRVLLGDVDGDGLADIVLVEDGRVTLWVNQSGAAWSDPVVIDGTPSVSDVDSIRLADVLGSGIAGVLWSRDAASTQEQFFFLDFTGGLKPYLLNATSNNMGATSRIEYASSTRFYLEDQHLPETRWKTTLPFPVQVVSRVEVIDEISRGQIDDRVFVPSRVLGRRGKGIPRIRPRRSARHRSLRTISRNRASSRQSVQCCRSGEILPAARDAHMVPPGCCR